MIDYSKYNETSKTVTFTNGKEFKVYSKETKSGVRYFYLSPSNHRMMPVSKNDIK
jgi:hypothetical protein